MEAGFSLINMYTEKTIRGSPYMDCCERCAMLEDCFLWTDRRKYKTSDGNAPATRGYTVLNCDLYRQDPESSSLSKASMERWGDHEGRTEFLEEFGEPDAANIRHGFLGGMQRVAPTVAGFSQGHEQRTEEGRLQAEPLQGPLHFEVSGAEHVPASSFQVCTPEDWSHGRGWWVSEECSEPFDQVKVIYGCE
jgi:hypothetical protein